MATKLATIQKQVVAVKDMVPADLKDKASADALVKVAARIQTESKALKAEDDALKAKFKSLCAEDVAAGCNVAVYGWDEGKKYTLTLKGGGAEIDDAAVLAGLYEMYGERPGDYSGRAWAAFVAISDPAPMPRVLNADKLAAALKQAERIALGIDDGQPIITKAVVDAATTIKAPTVAATLSNITKAEVKAHEQDGWEPVYVASPR